jgi:hypothetical protein
MTPVPFPVPFVNSDEASPLIVSNGWHVGRRRFSLVVPMFPKPENCGRTMHADGSVRLMMNGTVGKCPIGKPFGDLAGAPKTGKRFRAGQKLSIASLNANLPKVRRRLLQGEGATGNHAQRRLPGELKGHRLSRCAR